MSRTLTAADRSVLIRLAGTLPAGSGERKAILAGLSKRGQPLRTLQAAYGDKWYEYQAVKDTDGTIYIERTLWKVDRGGIRYPAGHAALGPRDGFASYPDAVAYGRKKGWFD